MLLGKLKMGAIAGVLASLFVTQAVAQSAVPLEPSLLQHTWWVVDFPGKKGESQAPTLKLVNEGKTIEGKTACDTEWWADIDLKFPKITVNAVNATAYDCPDRANVTTFLTVMENAVSFRTTREGLELVDKKGKRVALMVAGG